MTIPALYALGSVVVVSLISLVGIITLSWKDAVIRRFLFLLVSLAVGALFGDAIIHLIPEAFSKTDSATASFFMLVGIFLFFILEKILHWHHTHGEGHEDIAALLHSHDRIDPVGRLVLVSDAIHNFIDGVIIAAAYLVSIEIGIATTIAVVLHEIPQEIGDFGILIHAGYSKARALLINFFTALFAILGAVIVLILGDVAAFVPAMTALAAGSFLYIAGSDLVPELHRTSNIRHSLGQLAAILVGIALMFALLFLE